MTLKEDECYSLDWLLRESTMKSHANGHEGMPTGRMETDMSSYDHLLEENGLQWGWNEFSSDEIFTNDTPLLTPVQELSCLHRMYIG
mmetsp:Transcript_42024/g.127442  ORF Transcript_42024/g.127442 Transcript_42024/m.127442 type:complete len:87 (+) Transcript_42024:446-706(+)